MGHDSRDARSQRWFRRLVSLFPSDFRAQHQGEMEQLFRDQLGEVEGRGPISLLGLWAETLWGAIRSAPREHAAILRQDLVSALRVLRSYPGTTVVVVATLAVGIGAVTSVFSVLNTVQLRPLPFESGDRLVRVYLSDRGQPPLVSLRPGLYRTVAEEGVFFERIVAQRFTDMTVQGPDGPERVAGMAVTRGWADTLGIEPLIGRSFSEKEERLGRDSRVALVGFGFWQRMLGGSEAAVGEEIELDGERFTVVGVLPPGFRYPYENEIWIPLDLERRPEALWGLNVQARLRPGVTLADARTELALLTGQLAQTERESLAGMQLWAVPTRDVLADGETDRVVTLLTAVAFLLLLVCVNVGNLVLARSLSRQREFALRTALGASRGRQVRQVLTESLVLAALGGGLGLVLTWGARDLLAGLLPGRLSNLVGEVPIDWRVVVFALLASLATGGLFGLAPAVRAAGTRLSGLLQEGGRTTGGPRRLRLMGLLVLGETALALVLVASATAMVEHYRELSGLDLGYPEAGLLTAQTPLDGPRYREAVLRDELVRQAEARLAAVPGVAKVGVTCIFPSPEGNFLADVQIEGRVSEPDERNSVNHRLVTPGFFEAMGIPVLAGRSISARDRADGEPIAVVSRAMADRFWPGESPVGRRVRNAREGDEGAWMRVVGVVADVREHYDIEETWYLPYAQHAGSGVGGQAVFVMRSDLPTSEVRDSVRQAIQSVDGSLPVERIVSARERYHDSLEEERTTSWLAGSFALFGLVIALLGVGGVTAFAVAARRHEMGLRIALGAERSDLLRNVLSGVARWAALGVGAGLFGYGLLARWLAARMPDSGSLPPTVLAVLALFLVVSGVAAAAFPAVRASRVDPLDALRRE